MKVKDLLKEIKNCKDRYPDILEWEVAIENHRNPESCPNCKNNIIKSYKNEEDKWEYIKCHGFWTKFPKQKVFTINIHY